MLVYKANVKDARLRKLQELKLSVVIEAIEFLRYEIPIPCVIVAEHPGTRYITLCCIPKAYLTNISYTTPHEIVITYDSYDCIDSYGYADEDTIESVAEMCIDCYSTELGAFDEQIIETGERTVYA